MPDIEQILEDFEYLGDWEDRYRYVIELGRELPPLAEDLRTQANKVRGCASQVWLASDVRTGSEGGDVMEFAGDSDAHIVRGLIAILFSLYSGRTPDEILGTDARAIFARLALEDHLTQQRANGLVAMVERIRSDAAARVAEAAIAG